MEILMDWSKYPRCKAYLEKQGDNLRDDLMNEYWAAVCVAHSFTEPELKAHGINFNVGDRKNLLPKMEEFLSGRTRKKITPSKAKKILNPLDAITKAVSADQIEAAKTAKGGWKRNTTMGWGVPWPLPKGWKEKLISNYENQKNQLTTADK